MATTIQALGDTIKIGKAFVSGKDRIAVNGQVVYEGKLAAESPQKFRAGRREYAVETRVVSKLTSAIAVHLAVYENHQLVHSGVYDQHGKPVQDEAEAKHNGAMQACSMVGAILGVGAMMALNTATGVVPGGAIGGAIGGGVGGALGYGIGSLFVGGGRK